MSKDGTRLSRLGVLAPAALSACIDASVLAAPAAGAIVSTVLKELSKAFMLKRWFHGVMSAQEAERLLMEKGRNGSYLVRESQTHPGEFVLSVRVRGRVSHVMIHREQDKYDVGSGEQFDDLVGLIEHFRAYPMTETSGDVLRLLQPVSGATAKPSDSGQTLNKAQAMIPPKNHHGGTNGQLQSLLQQSHFFTTLEGLRNDNVTKNRYRTVVPYDQTRVVLPPTELSGDYINASYIMSARLFEQMTRGNSLQGSNESLYSNRSQNSDTAPRIFKSFPDDAIGAVQKTIRVDKVYGNLPKQEVVKDKYYIATQGCLWTTMNDFWLMIALEDIRVIAMITLKVEKGKQKCERYWPLSGTTERYGEICVTTVREQYRGHYVIRELEVLMDVNICRTVYQYQFLTWPDHGVPHSTEGILNFISDINSRMLQISHETNAPKRNVMCVHCSAGIGRTGSFIVLDMLIDRVKAEGIEEDIDIMSTVKLVRAQRPGMVQNKHQYNFIYCAIRDYAVLEQCKLKRLGKCDAKV